MVTIPGMVFLRASIAPPCGASQPRACAAGWLSRQGCDTVCPAMSGSPIYHLCRAADWESAAARGSYAGSAQDRRDGFLHFSTAAQIRESARKHRAGERDLLLLTVAPDRLGERLRWEPSRGGALFPHLHGELPVDAVRHVQPLPLAA